MQSINLSKQTTTSRTDAFYNTDISLQAHLKQENEREDRKSVISANTQTVVKNWIPVFLFPHAYFSGTSD